MRDRFKEYAGKLEVEHAAKEDARRAACEIKAVASICDTVLVANPTSNGHSSDVAALEWSLGFMALPGVVSGATLASSPDTAGAGAGAGKSTGAASLALAAAAYCHYAAHGVPENRPKAAALWRRVHTGALARIAATPSSGASEELGTGVTHALFALGVLVLAQGRGGSTGATPAAGLGHEPSLGQARALLEGAAAHGHGLAAHVLGATVWPEDDVLFAEEAKEAVVPSPLMAAEPGSRNLKLSPARVLPMGPSSPSLVHPQRRRYLTAAETYAAAARSFAAAGAAAVAEAEARAVQSGTPTARVEGRFRHVRINPHAEILNETGAEDRSDGSGDGDNSDNQSSNDNVHRVEHSSRVRFQGVSRGGEEEEDDGADTSLVHSRQDIVTERPLDNSTMRNGSASDDSDSASNTSDVNEMELAWEKIEEAAVQDVESSSAFFFDAEGMTSWCDADLGAFRSAAEVHAAYASVGPEAGAEAGAAVAKALWCERRATSVPKPAVLSRYVDALGREGFYRGQVAMVRRPATPPCDKGSGDGGSGGARDEPGPLEPGVPGHSQFQKPLAQKQWEPGGFGVLINAHGYSAGGCFHRGCLHGFAVQRFPNGAVAFAGCFSQVSELGTIILFPPLCTSVAVKVPLKISNEFAPLAFVQGDRHGCGALFCSSGGGAARASFAGLWERGEPQHGPLGDRVDARARSPARAQSPDGTRLLECARRQSRGARSARHQPGTPETQAAAAATAEAAEALAQAAFAVERTIPGDSPLCRRHGEHGSSSVMVPRRPSYGVNDNAAGAHLRPLSPAIFSQDDSAVAPRSPLPFPHRPDERESSPPAGETAPPVRTSQPPARPGPPASSSASPPPALLSEGVSLPPPSQSPPPQLPPPPPPPRERPAEPPAPPGGGGDHATDREVLLAVVRELQHRSFAAGEAGEEAARAEVLSDEAGGLKAPRWEQPGWQWESLMHWASARPLAEWEGVAVARANPNQVPARCTRGGAKVRRGPPRVVDCGGGALPNGADVVVVLDLSNKKLSAAGQIPAKGARRAKAKGSAAKPGAATAVAAASPDGLVLHVPPSLGRLRGLMELNLMGNGLGGPVPASLGGLGRSLRKLNLGFNRLTGPLPIELARLTSLTHLSLVDNRLRIVPLEPALVAGWRGGLAYVNFKRNVTNSSTEAAGLPGAGAAGATDWALSVDGFVAGVLDADLCGSPEGLFAKLAAWNLQ